MKIVFSDRFTKRYKKSPKVIQKKIDKQLEFLAKDFSHPSLRIKKMSRFDNVWEARVSKGYRMRFSPFRDKILMITVGPHDEGLGKK